MSHRALACIEYAASCTSSNSGVCEFRGCRTLSAHHSGPPPPAAVLPWMPGVWVCGCICMVVYICVCGWVCGCLDVYVYIRICVCICMCVYMYIFIYMLICIYIRMSVCAAVVDTVYEALLHHCIKHCCTHCHTSGTHAHTYRYSDAASLYQALLHTLPYIRHTRTYI